jgi:hypothetical protein
MYQDNEPKFLKLFRIKKAIFSFLGSSVFFSNLLTADEPDRGRE